MFDVAVPLAMTFGCGQVMWILGKDLDEEPHAGDNFHLPKLLELLDVRVLVLDDDNRLIRWELCAGSMAFTDAEGFIRGRCCSRSSDPMTVDDELLPSNSSSSSTRSSWERHVVGIVAGTDEEVVVVVIDDSSSALKMNEPVELTPLEL